MISLRSLLVPVGIGALLLPVAPSVTAAAPTPSSDSAGVAAQSSAPAYVDLKAVKVKHTKKKIKITYRSTSTDDVLVAAEWLLIDTKPKRPGPELQVGFARFSEGWAFAMRNWKYDKSKAAKRKWGAGPDKAGTCEATVSSRIDAHNNFSPVTVTIRKKKGCVTAKKVRVQVVSATSVFSETDDEFRNVVDRMPNGKRIFTDWVKQRGKKAKARRFADGPDPIS